MTNQNPSCGARAFVLAGPALALLFTVFSVATGTGVGFISGVWFCAALWSNFCALSSVLWRGFRHGDWSAFSRHELPDGRCERFDWATRTGRYAWRRELEEQELHGHDPCPPFP